MSHIKLKEFCERNAIAYITGYRWFKAGQIPGAYQTDSGTILIPDDKSTKSEPSVDAISLFLKKTVEFSKNNSTVEDFAAYVISTFNLKINNGPEGPKYSKQRPKSEDVQKHFQQFIPKGEKPRANRLSAMGEPTQELVEEFSLAVDPKNYVPPTSVFAAAPISTTVAMSPTESTVNQSVDLNTTPQSINYTGSNSLAFSGSLISMPNASFGGLANNTSFNLATQEYADAGGLYFTSMSHSADLSDCVETTDFIGSFQPTQKELESVKTSAEVRLNQPRNKRGRKPNKR